jgi:hypothetical protein
MLNTTDRTDESKYRPVTVSALTSRERLLTCLALVVITAVDVGLSAVGFARIYAAVGHLPTISLRPHRSHAETQRLGTAVERACAYYARAVTCLPRAISIVVFLRLAGIPAQLVIGVKRMPFAAHSWVEVDGEVVSDHPWRAGQYRAISRA